MDQDLEGDFMKLVEEVRVLARRRNDVVHAIWGKDPEGRVRWKR